MRRPPRPEIVCRDTGGDCMSSARLASCRRLLPGLVLGGVLFAASLTGARAVSTPAEISYPGGGKLYLINANGTDRRVLVSGGPAFRVDEWGGTAWTRDGKQ